MCILLETSGFRLHPRSKLMHPLEGSKWWAKFQGHHHTHWKPGLGSPFLVWPGSFWLFSACREWTVECEISICLLFFLSKKINFFKLKYMSLLCKKISRKVWKSGSNNMSPCQAVFRPKLVFYVFFLATSLRYACCLNWFLLKDILEGF